MLAIELQHRDLGVKKHGPGTALGSDRHQMLQYRAGDTAPALRRHYRHPANPELGEQAAGSDRLVAEVGNAMQCHGVELVPLALLRATLFVHEDRAPHRFGSGAQLLPRPLCQPQPCQVGAKVG